MLFNFRWLHAKLSCMPLRTVVADYEDAIEACRESDVDQSVSLLMYALRLSSSVLGRLPYMLAAQIIGRLLPYYRSHDYIASLGNVTSSSNNITSCCQVFQFVASK